MQGLILVFDVTNKSSFNNLELWLEDIKKNIAGDLIILFGNKFDIPKEHWEFTTDEAKAFAQKHNLIYFETSAKTKQGINEGFSYIANEAYKKMDTMDDDIIVIKRDIIGSTQCFQDNRRKKNKNKKI